MDRRNRRVLLTPDPVWDTLFIVAQPRSIFAASERVFPTAVHHRVGGALYAHCEALAMLDLSTNLYPICPLSEDEGGLIRAQLVDWGIITDGLRGVPGPMRRNVIADCLDDKVAICMPPNTKIGPQHFDLETICEASQLIVSGNLPLQIVEEAIEIAHQFEVAVAWNPSPTHLPYLRELAPRVQLLQLNLEECTQTLGEAPTSGPSAAKAIAKLTDADNVVITYGDGGAFGKSRDSSSVIFRHALSVMRIAHTSMGDRYFALIAWGFEQSKKLSAAMAHAQIAFPVLFQRLMRSDE